MSHRSSPIRAAVLALTFASLPASAAFAQHRGHHQGGGGGGGAAQARPAAKPAQAARPAARPAAKPMQHAQTTNGQANVVRPRPSDSSIVSSLHSMRTQLAQADQDYNGHRGRAMRDIDEALRLMGNRSGMGGMGSVGAGRSGNPTGVNRASGSTVSNRSGTATGTGTTNGSGSGTTSGSGTRQPMNQAGSDTQLRQTRQMLRNLESRMDTSGMNPANYVQAKSAVQSALRQLNLALIDN